MEKLVKESEYFLAWLVFWLCYTVAGFILGGVAGGVMGVFLGGTRVDLHAIRLICAGVGFLLSLPLSYILFRVFVARMIVKKAEARLEGLTRELANNRVEATSQ
jgi:ABC-type microcin C transport system permease subunit YejE